MDLVAELMKLDWSYTHKDGKNFINNEAAYENSATFRIINGTFISPFTKIVEVPYKTKNQPMAQAKTSVEDEYSTKPDANDDKSPNKQEKQQMNKPDHLHLPLYPNKSILTAQEHALGLRVLCHFLHNGPVLTSNIPLPSSNVSANEVKKFHNLMTKINTERFAFTAYVQNVWTSKNCSRLLDIIPDHQKYVEELWKEQLDTVLPKYPQFYQSGSMVPLVSQTNEPVDLELIKTLKTNLNPGPGIHIPNLNVTHFYLPKNYVTIKKKHQCREVNFTVNDDETCEKFAVENNVNIVTTPSSLQCIVDNIPKCVRSWNIPFTVKEHKIKDPKGKLVSHTVVYMEPPLPPQNLSTRAKCEWAYSALIKNSLLRDSTQKSSVIPVQVKCDFCKSKNSKEVTSETTSSPVKENNDTSNESKVALMSDTESQCSDDEDKLVMDIDESLLEPPPKPVVTGIMTRSKASLANVQAVETPNTRKNKRKLVAPKCTCNNKFIKLNARSDRDLCEDDFSYNLWKLHQSSEVNILSKTSKKEIVILVRSKGDGYLEKDGTKNMCILEPKLEYQLEYGYECLTPKEAAAQWTWLHFNTDAQLLRARITPNTADLLMIEKQDKKTINDETAKHSTWTPSKSKQMLFNIFSELSRLRPGQYILSREEKHGAFAMVYSSTSEQCKCDLNLGEAFKVDISDIGIKQTAPWTPIDCHLPTAQHLKHKIMPCMFNPHAKSFHVEKASAKKNKKKSKSKNSRRRGNKSKASS